MVFLYILIPCWLCGVEDNGQCEGDMMANLPANPTGACAVGSQLVELLNFDNIKKIFTDVGSLLYLRNICGLHNSGHIRIK